MNSANRILQAWIPVMLSPSLDSFFPPATDTVPTRGNFGNPCSDISLYKTLVVWGAQGAAREIIRTGRIGEGCLSSPNRFPEERTLTSLHVEIPAANITQTSRMFALTALYQLARMPCSLSYSAAFWSTSYSALPRIDYFPLYSK